MSYAGSHRAGKGHAAIPLSGSLSAAVMAACSAVMFTRGVTWAGAWFAFLAVVAVAVPAADRWRGRQRQAR